MSGSNPFLFFFWGTKMSIWSFWAKMDVISDYIM